MSRARKEEQRKNIIRASKEVASDAGRMLQDKTSNKLEKELAGEVLGNRKVGLLYNKK